MLRRIASSAVYFSIHNHRFLTLTAVSNRPYPKDANENLNEVKNQHRDFANFHSFSKKLKKRTFQNKPQEQKFNDSDVKRPQFNSYSLTGSKSSKTSFRRKPIDDDEQDIFAEEKENLTILGSDKKAFSLSSTNSTDKSTTSAVSLNKKTETLNVPLEVLVQPDLRDLYSEEQVHQSLELYIDEMHPSLRPFTFDLAYLINESPTLKRFVEMGVDVYRWNQPNIKGKYVLTLDFERDCVQHLVFLNELGIRNKNLAEYLSYNPWIFKESLDDLRVRIHYLESRGFNNEDIRDILIRAPFLLNLSTKMIDTKLNWFIKKFNLTESNTKEFVIRAPKLLTLPLQDISNTYFNMNKLLDFQHEDLQKIFQQYPKLFIQDYKLIELNFDFLYNEMNITRKRLLNYPPVLKQSFQRLRSRCLYLKHLKRNQFDPTKPNFVSLKDLCLKTDDLFCQHVTKTPVKHYIDFMKTL